jgi:hypothetical protein
MSFDLGVWYSDVPLTREEAGEFYRHLNEDRVFVRRHPQFDAFWADLRAMFPDRASPEEPETDFGDWDSAMLQTPADLKAEAAAPVVPAPTLPEMPPAAVPYDDDTPWAATPAPAGFAVALPIRWSRVDEVAPDIFTLVRRHELVIFNPQETWVWFPPKLKRRKARPAAPLVRLQIAGKAPELAVTIRLDADVLLQATLPTRRAAHAQARASTLEKGLAFYEVDDPGSLAQSLVWDAMDPGSPDHPPGVPPGAQVSTLRIKDD